MAIRDLKSASTLKNKARGAGAKGQNVFGTHGNDALKEHAGLSQQGADKAAETPMTKMLNTVVGNDEEQSDLKMTTTEAVMEVCDAIIDIQSQPELLSQLLNPQLDHADQTTQILEYLAVEILDTDVCDTLAAGTYASLEASMVISQQAEKACLMNGPELETLGVFGSILWMVVDESLKMNLAPLQIAAKKAGEEEEEQDSGRVAASLNPVIATLRLECS